MEIKNDKHAINVHAGEKLDDASVKTANQPGSRPQDFPGSRKPDPQKHIATQTHARNRNAISSGNLSTAQRLAYLSPGTDQRAPTPHRSMNPEGSRRSKRELTRHPADLYTKHAISNMPLRKEFSGMETPTRDASQALAENNDAMTAITGRSNLKQYDSLRNLTNSATSKEGKLLSRRIQNTLDETYRIMDNAQRRLADSREKPDITRYLSIALATDNQNALEEAYTRLRNTAFQSFQRLKNFKTSDWNAITLFERRDKSQSLPDRGRNSPLTFANPKDPRKIYINMEALEDEVPELLKKQSSGGHNRELVDGIMNQLTRLDGNTRDSVPIRREQTNDGRSLGSAQMALDDFQTSNYVPDVLEKWSVCPDDPSVIDTLGKPPGTDVTNDMRNEAKKLLDSRSDQSDVGKNIKWVYDGPVQDFEKARFFYDPMFRADEMTANTDSATIYLRDIGLQRSYNESVANDTLDKDGARASFNQFSQKSQDLYSSFPDPNKVARTIARSKLRERTGQDLDPDKTYLHQFERSQTDENPDAYTGYEHKGKPKYSETLTQAYMDNFKIFRNRETQSFWDTISNAAGKQVANGTYPSHLDDPDLRAPFFSSPNVLTGLYTANADSGKFGPENEVKYLPSDLKDDIFDANVMSQVENSQKDFWQENKTTWRSLAKGQFIEEARRALVKGTLSKEAYETAIKGGAPNIVMYDSVTMNELEESAAPDPDVKVNFLGIKLPRYLSTSPATLPNPNMANSTPYNFISKSNIMSITGKDGREILYTPGDEQPFREFSSWDTLDKWFMEQVKNDSSRTAFLEHFSLSDRQEAVDSALKDLAQGPVRQDLKPSIEKTDVGVQFGTRDAFSTLARLTEERTEKDADTLINSNGEVRLQSAKNILQTVNMAAMPMMPMLGPVGIVLDIGLTAAQAGVDAAITATADTPEERNAALSNASLGLLFLGINAGLAARFLGMSAKNPPSTTPPDQAFLKTGHSFLEKQRGFRNRVQVLESGSGHNGPTETGKNGTVTPRSFGEDLDFPWIDDQVGATESALYRQLFAKGPSAARLQEFYKNPGELCYDAMVETFDALKNEGEQPKAIGMLIYKNPWDESPSNHFATLIKKSDGDFVVDPTLRQFDPSLPESSTILPLDQWEYFFKNKTGNDNGIIILEKFNKPLDARKAASDIHNVAGKYYQNSMIGSGDINILKYNDKLENSIIKELHKNENILKIMKNDPQSIEDVKADVENLQFLKKRFGLLSPHEIDPSTTIRGKLKRQFLKDAVDETDVGAFRTLADDRGVVTTVSGKKYIKISKNSFLNFSYNSSNEHSGEIWGSMQGNKAEIFFDDQTKRWTRSPPATDRTL